MRLELLHYIPLLHNPKLPSKYTWLCWLLCSFFQKTSPKRNVAVSASPNAFLRTPMSFRRIHAKTRCLLESEKGIKSPPSLLPETSASIPHSALSKSKMLNWWFMILPSDLPNDAQDKLCGGLCFLKTFIARHMSKTSTEISPTCPVRWSVKGT